MEKTITSSKNGQTGLELLFKEVCVSVGDKQILKKVCGAVSSGQLMAIMGPSGKAKVNMFSSKKKNK